MKADLQTHVSSGPNLLGARDGALAATLKRFRATHPTRSTIVAGALWALRWEYIACGQGEEALLFLPGAPGRGETAFQHILALESSYRIIAPSYPASLSTVAHLVDGLAGVLTAEGIKKAHVIGGSYSGLFAQSFVRRYPEKSISLVLSDTGIPNRERAKKYAIYLRMLRLLPLGAIRSLWRMGAYLYLREIEVQKQFWRAYFRELISNITKEECVGRLKAWIDFDRNSRFAPADLRDWPGRILILEARLDTTFPPEERSELRRLYPQAQVITFDSGGHAASLARWNEYIAAIRDFVGRVPSERRQPVEDAL